jgi:D-sedoheptulose 7-phosphate isomerase
MQSAANYLNKLSEIEEVMKDLIQKYPDLTVCKEAIQEAFETLKTSFEKGGKLLIAGNGGSEADAQHIVGELMKSFEKPRALDHEVSQRLEKMYKEDKLTVRLQGALPAITLGMNPTLVSAYANDVDPAMVFAQEVYGLGQANDVLIALTTSGNSENVLLAAKVARAKNMPVIGICGQKGGKLKGICTTAILLPAERTYVVQEYTLPVYHALCRMLEIYFW